MSEQTQEMTLFGYISALPQLLETLEEVRADADLTPQEQVEAIQVIQGEIQKVMAGELKKVDSIVYVMDQYEAMAGACAAEAAHLKERQHRLEAQRERLEAYVLAAVRAKLERPCEACQASGDYDQAKCMECGGRGYILPKGAKLKGETRELGIKKDPPHVAVPQPELVPDAYLRCTVTMSLQDWLTLKILLSIDDSETGKRLHRAFLEANPKVEPMKSEIAKVLKSGKGVPGAVLVSGERLKID